MAREFLDFKPRRRSFMKALAAIPLTSIAGADLAHVESEQATLPLMPLVQARTAHEKGAEAWSAC